MFAADKSLPAVACLLLAGALGVAGGCSTDSNSERDDAKPTAQKEDTTATEAPHRFEIPVSAGDGHPLPVFVVKGLAHPLLLMAKTRAAPAEACAAPLPRAFASATSAWHLADTSSTALLERDDLLTSFTPEDDAVFDARVRKGLTTPDEVKAWEAVHAQRDGVLRRLKVQQRFLREDEVELAHKRLSLHLLGLTMLQVTASSFPSLVDCLDEAVPSYPLLRSIPLDDELTASVREAVARHAAGPVVAADLLATLKAGEERPPHVTAPSPVHPFSLEAVEAVEAERASSAAGHDNTLAQLGARAASFGRSQAAEEPTLLWLAVEVLAGPAGVVQQLLDAGLTLEQLRADAPFAEVSTLKEEPLAFQAAEVDALVAAVEPLQVTPLWEASASQKHRLQRLTGRVFSSSIEGTQPPVVETFLIKADGVGRMDLPDGHRMLASFSGASLVVWMEAGQTRHGVIDLVTGERIDLEGPTTLWPIEGDDTDYLLLTRVEHPDRTLPSFVVRVGVSAEPVTVEELSLPPFRASPEFHFVDGGVVVGAANREGSGGCQLARVAQGRSRCIASSYEEAQAFKDARRGLIIKVADRRDRAGPPAEATWIHDYVAHRRFRLPDSWWRPFSGAQYDYVTTVLFQPSTTRYRGPERLYSQGRLFTYEGKLGRCRSITMPAGPNRVFCDYQAPEDSPARRVMLAEDASTAWLLPDGLDFHKPLFKFAASDETGERLLFTNGSRTAMFTGLPACPGGWRAQGRPLNGWLPLSCSAPTPHRSVLLNVDDGRAKAAPKGWALAELRDDGRAVLSDAAISERRNLVSKVGITAPLFSP